MICAPSLRADQQRSVDALRGHIRAGRRHVLLQAPTAWGKGVVATSTIAGSVVKARSSLFVSHLSDINLDVVGRLAACGVEASIMMGEHDRCVEGSLATVATVQTLAARGWPDVDFIVIDEAHRSAAESYQAAFRSRAIVVGMTATPERADGAALEGFDVIVPGPQIRELVELGILAPIDCSYPSSETKELAADPVEVWPHGRPGFCFASSVPHSRAIAAGLCARGIPAAHCDADTPDREDLIQQFNEGWIDVLCNYRLFVEGVNAPRAEVCMMASRFSSAGGYLQALGRVRRVLPGKGSALMLDLRGNWHAWGEPDDDRSYHLDGTPIRTVQALAPVMQCAGCLAWFPPLRVCPVCAHVRPDAPLPKVRERALVERRAVVPEAVQRAALDRFVDEALAKGHKPIAALHRFKGAFGGFPIDWLNEALRRRRSAA